MIRSKLYRPPIESPCLDCGDVVTMEWDECSEAYCDTCTPCAEQRWQDVLATLSAKVSEIYLPVPQKVGQAVTIKDGDIRVHYRACANYRVQGTAKTYIGLSWMRQAVCSNSSRRCVECESD